MYYSHHLCANSEFATNTLADWTKHLRTWNEGGDPAGLPRVAKPNKKNQPRDVFAFFISGTKERAPAAAMEVISILQGRENGRSEWQGQVLR